MSKMNRRAVLAGAASAAVAAPAATLPREGPDPIFAAIEAHRAARAHLEDNPWKKKVHLSHEDEAELDRRTDVDADAASALADTEPTTIAGAVALSRYVAKLDDYHFVDDDEKTKPLSFFTHSNLAAALEKIARSA